MVIFNPPIESHLVVPLPSRSSSSTATTATGRIQTVDIYFRAQDADNKLQPGDQVELWTNAPDCTGAEVGQGDEIGIGEWRAVKFDQIGQALEKNAKSNEEKQIESPGPGKRLIIPTKPLSSALPTVQAEIEDQTRNLIAQVTLPLSTSDSPSAAYQFNPEPFEYTFRIVYPDGRIWWLGGLGANGTVRFETAEHSRSELDKTGTVGMWGGWEGYCLPARGGDGPNTLDPIPLVQALQSRDPFGLAHLWRDGQAKEDHLWAFSTEAVNRDGRGKGEEIFLVPRTGGVGFTFNCGDGQDGDEDEVEYMVLKGSPDLDDLEKGNAGGKYRFYRAGHTDPDQKVFAVGYPSVGWDRDQNENTKIFISLRSSTKLESGLQQICLYLPGMGEQEGRFALWNEETGGSISVPSRTEPSDRVETPDDVVKVEISLRLPQGKGGTTTFAHLECVKMYQFGDPPGTGSIGCSGPALRSMDWVRPVERQAEEDFEEVVLVPSSPSESGVDSNSDENGDETGTPGGMTASRGDSAWATAGSSGPRSMPGSDSASEGVKGGAGEAGLLSPRTVDLHEVEDRHLNDENDEHVADGIKTTNNKVDEVGNKGSSESDSGVDLPDVHADGRNLSPESPSVSDSGSDSGSPVSSGHDQMQPFVPNPTLRWITLFFRGLGMKTLGGFFRWMITRFSTGQLKGEDGRARILEGEEADEETPLLSQARGENPLTRGKEDGTLPIPEAQTAAANESNKKATPPLSTPPLLDDPARIALPETPAPATAPEREPTYKIITRTRTRTVVEPGYMKLVSSQTGRVTLLTDVDKSLRVVHRAGEVESELEVDGGEAKKDDEGLKVIRVDTTGLPDPFELRISRNT